MRMITYLTPGYPRALFETLAGEVDADLLIDSSRSGPDPADNPFADGRADIGWICSTSYAQLRTQPNPSVVLAGVAWAPLGAEGRPEYFSDLVVPVGSPATSIDDLRGTRIGGNDESSLSGFHSWRIELHRRGHDPSSFADIVLTGGHNQSLDQLLAGDLDAGIIDSVVHTLRKRAEPRVAEDLRVIGQLGPWPTQPLVARSSLSAGDVSSVRKAMLAAGAKPWVQKELRAAGLERLVSAGDGHCDPVIDAIGQL